MISAAYCNKELCRKLDKAGIEAHHVMAFEKGGSWYKKYTLDIANRWLREVHRLHITVFHSSYLYGSSPFYWDIDRMVDAKSETTQVGSSLATSTATGDYTYKTYEAALEAAIRYCVENLIKED